MSTVQWTTAQIAAIELPGPLLVRASAGSGKTAVLIERYVRLLHQGHAPESILLLTFTREAARQLLQRAIAHPSLSPRLQQKVQERAWVGTIHSFCLAVVRDWGEMLDLPPFETVATEFEIAAQARAVWQAIQEACEPELLLPLFAQFSPHQLFEIAQEAFSLRFMPQASEICSPLLEICHRYSRALEQRLLGKGMYTFDSLEGYAARALSEIPECRSHYQECFEEVLLDEFQDTSLTQWHIFQHVLSNRPEKAFFVGDPKQSIYRFRKAEIEVFWKAEDWVTQHGGQKVQLAENFRTDPALLTQTQSLSTFLFPDPRWGSTCPGRAATNPPGELRQYRVDPKTERLFVAQKVAELLARGTPASHLALLFRTSDRIVDFANALQDRGIATRLRAVDSVSAHQSLWDIYYYLRALAFPNDLFARAHLAHRVHRFGESGTSLDAFCSPVSNVKEALLQWYRLTPQLGNEPEVVFRVLEYFGERDLGVAEALGPFFSWMEKDLRCDELEGQDGVQLMTAHAAKGLEFEHVFLVDTARRTTSQLPSLLWASGEAPLAPFEAGWEKALESDRQKDREEGDRILYVAATRARQHLWVFLPEAGRGTIPQESWAGKLQAWKEQGKNTRNRIV